MYILQGVYVSGEKNENDATKEFHWVRNEEISLVPCFVEYAKKEPHWVCDEGTSLGMQ